MKLSPLLVSVPTLLLAGCSQPVVDERSAAAGGTAGNCVYASQAYRQGTITCQEGVRYRCESGVWNSTFRAC
ncbi:MAG TPA: hypothetical protein VJ778_11505 [Burkholderiales bacterium]|nr:hypothetical protein [Burkholderiales bacterium]